MLQAATPATLAGQPGVPRISHPIAALCLITPRRKALYSSSSGVLINSKPRQQQRHAAAGSSSSTSHSRLDSEPSSPGLQEALEAIALAESKLSAQQQESLRQQQQQQAQLLRQGPSFAAAAAAQCRELLLAPAASSPSLSLSSDHSSAWGNLAALQDSSTDPWGSSSGSMAAAQQQRQQQHMRYQETVLSSSPGDTVSCPSHHQRQQQGDEVEEPWPVIAGQPESSSMSQAQAYSWRRFTLQFAQAAWEAGDDDAAEGALRFGASEAIFEAVFAAGDHAAAAAELEGVVEQAAAAGLTVHELLQAQQEELLLQISSSKRKGRAAWRQVALDWDVRAAGEGSSQSSSRCASPAHHVQLPDVVDESAFPQLEPPASPSSSWQQVGPSPHAISRHWKGGRLAPKAKGIKLLHTPNSSSSSSSNAQHEHKLRPSTLDLHWDLRMDGLAPMQRDGDAASEQLCSIDPWGGIPGAAGSSSQGADSSGQLCNDAQAAARTRQLLAEQEAAAAVAGARPGTGSSRDRCAQDTVRAMMEKAASKGAARPAGSGAALAAAAAPAGEQSRDGPCGSKALTGYDWGSLFKYAAGAGWLPVGKADGGGGSHFKLRRVLPLSGVTQTIMLPCTPSDSQRGVRNAAASFKKRDEEMRQLEGQAQAGQQAAAGAAAKVKASRRK